MVAVVTLVIYLYDRQDKDGHEDDVDRRGEGSRQAEDDSQNEDA